MRSVSKFHQKRPKIWGKNFCSVVGMDMTLDDSFEEDTMGMTVSSGSVKIAKDDTNLIGISIGGGAPLCPCVYVVQARSFQLFFFLRHCKSNWPNSPVQKLKFHAFGERLGKIFTVWVPTVLPGSVLPRVLPTTSRSEGGWEIQKVIK